MIQFQPAQVIVTEGSRWSPFSWAVRIFTRSWWTHVIMVTQPDEAIEAWHPRVRTIDLLDRIRELERAGRDYVVLDYPGITDEQRARVVEEALKYKGRLYDYVQLLVYALFGQFREDGPLRVVCSRLANGAYNDAGLPITSRRYVTPVELLYTRLKRIN